MRLTITIDLDNDAFGDDIHQRANEVERILKARCADWELKGLAVNTVETLRDVNGNRVGLAVVTP